MDITALLTLPALPGLTADSTRPAASLLPFNEVLSQATPVAPLTQPDAWPAPMLSLLPIKAEPDTPPVPVEDDTLAETGDAPWPLQTLALMASLPVPVTPLQQDAADNAPGAMPTRHETPLTAPLRPALTPVSPAHDTLLPVPPGKENPLLKPAAPVIVSEEMARPVLTSAPDAAAISRDLTLPTLAPSSAQATTAPVAAPVALSLSAPLGSSEWPQELGRQLIHFANGRQGEQRVTLQLNPAHLGPVSVSLTLDDQTAQAQFFSAHAPVRTVLEQAIPQLREALAEQGIQLGEASVGEERQRQAFSDQSSQPARITSAQSADEPGEQAAVATSLPHAPAGTIDLYA